MEGSVGKVFESRFPHTVSTRPVSVVLPSKDDVSSQKTIKDRGREHVNHALRNSSIAVGIGVVLLAPVVILATKGKLPKPVMKYLNKKTAAVSQKIAELKSKPQMTQAEVMYLKSLQRSSTILDAARGLVFNTGPLKDVLLEKGLKKIGLKKVCNAITGFFEKAAVKMTNIAYKKSNDAFALMKDGFLQANKSVAKKGSSVIEINGVSHSAQEWAKIADEKLQTIDSAYDAFRMPAVRKRYKWLAGKLNGLGDSVFDQTYGHLKEFIKKPKKWTTFITEDIVSPTKMKFAKQIEHKRKVITNTRQDTVKEIDSMVSTIQKSLDMSNTGSIDIIKRLNKALKNYRTDESSAVRTATLEEINAIIKDSDKVLDTSSYPLLSAQKIKKSLNTIRYFIESDKNGKIEELLDIYSHILPKEEFAQLQKIAKKSKNALENATYTESEKFVDKMRDLKSGSALTDVSTGLLIPLTSTAVGMSMADTKEKKRSVALNLGVPMFTGLGASMWATIAMYAAGPSLFLGLVTSTATSFVTSKINKYLKANDAKILSSQQPQNTMKTTA